MTYIQARYYDPVIGRFLLTDPIGYQDQLNLYAYVGNDPINATDPTGMQAVTDEERQFVDQGDLDSFWQSRQDRGDPVGDLGGQYGKEFADRSALSQVSSGILNTYSYLAGSNDAMERMDARGPQTGNVFDEGVEVMGDAVDQMGPCWDNVRQGLAEAHIDAVDGDNIGTPQLLSAGQITEYHHDVFGENGLPNNAFGGTPFTGGRWEAGITNALTGWCKGCDKE